MTEPEKSVRAASGEHLQQLLREDHRYVFTLIQKFHTPRGKPYPVLSDRADIIVMADEAHRSQYDTFALNMRNALPEAAFIGFTGTPLIKGEEERTREVFGDYVSIYNFGQSVEDRATVPLYYENRMPELQLTNENLNRDIERVLEDAALDEAQENRLEREFAREYHLITRDERLEKIAEDIVLRSPEELYYYRIWRDVMAAHISPSMVGRTLDRSAAADEGSLRPPGDSAHDAIRGAERP